MQSHELIITQTQKWILDVVIGHNFCPFAAREMKEGRVFYKVLKSATLPTLKHMLKESVKSMDSNESMETLFLIFPQNFLSFPSYLTLVRHAEQILKKGGYDGLYQIASFHPEYLFAGSSDTDPANYTNRSPYPMMQLLREASLSRAIDSYGDTSTIPRNNIIHTRAMGLARLQVLREACFHVKI